MSGDSQIREELGELFHDAVTQHEDVMAECKWTFHPGPPRVHSSFLAQADDRACPGLSILRLYNLTPSTLYYKYEAFLLSRPSGLRAKLAVLTLDTVRELRKEIQREQQTKAVISGPGAGGVVVGENTPKSNGVGLRKGKANMADLGGL
jgi:DNA polymerase alpha subunit B